MRGTFNSHVWVWPIRIGFPYLGCSRVQSDFSFLFWISYIKVVSNREQSSIVGIFVTNDKNVNFCSICRIQSEENLPLIEAIAKLIDQKLFAVRIRNIAHISNKRIANKQHFNNFVKKWIEFFVCYQWEITDFWVDSQVLWFLCKYERITQSCWVFQSKSLEFWFQTDSRKIFNFESP